MQLPSLTGNKSSKKERKQFIDQDPFEVLTEGIKTAVVDDLSKATVNDAWEQLLGIDKGSKPSHHGGDLTPGQELSLSHIGEKAHEVTEMGHEYIREIVHSGERASAETSREIQVKIQEIIIEIKQLANSTDDLQAQVEIISAETNTEADGTYHVNFLQEMVSWLRDLRMSVDDSLAWFGALRSKKASKQYGSMSKKHGTSFTLSEERSKATQTG